MGIQYHLTRMVVDHSYVNGETLSITTESTLFWFPEQTTSNLSEFKGLQFTFGIHKLVDAVKGLLCIFEIQCFISLSKNKFCFTILAGSRGCVVFLEYGILYHVIYMVGVPFYRTRIVPWGPVKWHCDQHSCTTKIVQHHVCTLQYIF